MLWWLVDHATVWYLLLGIITLVLVAAWYLNRRLVFLSWAAGVVGLILLVWLLTRLVVTDRVQLVQNIQAMAAGVQEGKPEEVFRYFSADFRYEHLKKEEFRQRAAKVIRRQRVRDLHLWDYDVEELDRSAGTARVAFRVRAMLEGDRPHLALCRLHFRREGGQWRLLGLQLFNPVTDTDRPIQLPLP